MNLLDVVGAAAKAAGALVEQGLLQPRDEKAAAAAILAVLRPSPPDITASYHDAERRVLADADELPKKR